MVRRDWWREKGGGRDVGGKGGGREWGGVKVI